MCSCIDPQLFERISIEEHWSQPTRSGESNKWICCLHNPILCNEAWYSRLCWPDIPPHCNNCSNISCPWFDMFVEDCNMDCLKSLSLGIWMFYPSSIGWWVHTRRVSVTVHYYNRISSKKICFVFSFQSLRFVQLLALLASLNFRLLNCVICIS